MLQYFPESLLPLVGDTPIPKSELIKRFREHNDTSKGIAKSLLIWLLSRPFAAARRYYNNLWLVE